jgi:hypothetical protein
MSLTVVWLPSGKENRIWSNDPHEFSEGIQQRSAFVRVALTGHAHDLPNVAPRREVISAAGVPWKDGFSREIHHSRNVRD